ncbi:MAG: hypothetical protein K2J46_00930, partial [Muribaculaceae bacterium]|nr:hypothetical protein [Muribaculaceae bacterium]
MYNTFSKVLSTGAAIFAFFTLCACSYVEEVETLSQKPTEERQMSTNEGTIHIRIPSLSDKTSATFTYIDLFQFSDGVFVNKMTVDPSKDNIVEFTRKPLTRIYALAGYKVEDTQKISESLLSAMTIPVPKDSYSAPVFFSSVTDIQDGADNLDIELHRGVARLDIDNEDSKLKIERVNISGASSCSHIFSTDGCTHGTVSANYSRSYESGIDGMEENAFILFETQSPITVTICGRRNGEAVEIISETPAITRNSIYTVFIDNETTSNAKGRTLSQSDDELPTASIKVRDWVEGDKKNGALDLEEYAIDIQRSSIPSGVRVNTGDNTITVPACGVTGMKIAFTTATPLRLGSVLSDTKGVSITPAAPLATDGGYISEFSIDVENQPKGAKQYQTTVFFNGSSSFFINIEVEPSPVQIPTVHIRAHDWMCFHAVSP